MKKILITLSFATLIFSCESQTENEIHFSSQKNKVSTEYMDSVNGYKLIIPIGIRNPISNPDTFPVYLLTSDTTSLKIEVLIGYKITYDNWIPFSNEGVWINYGLETTFRDLQFKEFPGNIIIWDYSSRKKWISSNSYIMEKD